MSEPRIDSSSRRQPARPPALARGAQPRDAKPATPGEPPTVELEVRKSGSSERVVRWSLIAIIAALLCGSAAFFVNVYEPMLAAGRARDRALEEVTASRDRALAEQAAANEARDAAQRERDALSTERDGLQARERELTSAVATRDAQIGALQAMRDALTEQLQSDIASGDLSIEETDGRVAVRLADQVLFAPGRAELSERGRAVLRRVATSLARMEDRVVQVEGHTDATPLTGEALERFGTNWELSTARATHVVRFLAEEGGIAGDRLVAAGFSEFRPVGDNRTAQGRRRNRRIELALVPRPRA